MEWIVELSFINCTIFSTVNQHRSICKDGQVYRFPDCIPLSRKRNHVQNGNVSE